MTPPPEKLIEDSHPPDTINASVVTGGVDRARPPGEPAIVPVAAAVSNAVFRVTGRHHRELPIQRHL